MVSKLKKEFQVVLRLAVALEVPARSTVREDNGVGRDSTQPLWLGFEMGLEWAMCWALQVSKVLSKG